MMHCDIHFGPRNLDSGQQKIDYVIKLNAVNILVGMHASVSEEMLSLNSQEETWRIHTLL